MNPWDPDVDVPVDRAARLLAIAFPHLADLPVAALAAGWDNAAFTVGPWVFRFPRRALGGELLRYEIAVLPTLADRLPVAIPNPVWVAGPVADYPYAFAGYRRLPGATACSVGLDPSARQALAGPLGAFLGALHRAEVPASAPGDTLRRAELPYRLAHVRERLAFVPDLTAIIEPLLTELADTPPWHGPARLMHGDLYARHLLVDDGALSGVIDWGDVHAGDPAVDLMIGVAFVPPAGHGAFRDAYGPIDAATWRRARFHALRYAVNLAYYARSVGDRPLADVAAWALDGARSGA